MGELPENRPLVSVAIVTYNHETFIAQALESVIRQQTNFTFEAIIGEDCSTDGTRQICEAFAKQYPETIRLLPSDRNYGMVGNFARTYLASTGLYFCVLDGDDFWTDAAKLQKQVDSLERFPGASLAYHEVSVVNHHGIDQGLFFPAERQETLQLRDFINGEHPKICSVLIRNTVPFRKRIESLLQKGLPLQDTYLVMAALEGGHYGLHSAEVMAAYRLHEHGNWSALNKPQKALLLFGNSLAFLKSFPRDFVTLGYGMRETMLHYRTILNLTLKKQLTVGGFFNETIRLFSSLPVILSHTFSIIKKHS